MAALLAHARPDDRPDEIGEGIDADPLGVALGARDADSKLALDSLESPRNVLERIAHRNPSIPFAVNRRYSCQNFRVPWPQMYLRSVPLASN